MTEPGGVVRVSDTISQVAESVLKHGFAVCSVDKDTAEAIVCAENAASHFFRETSNDIKIKYQNIVGGHLQGYNVPSEAKELYRALFGGKASATQPWPSKEMEDTSIRVAEQLHGLLYKCLEEIKSVLQKRGRNFESEPPKKRSRPCPEDIPQRLCDSKQKCPLDYFLYNGQNTAVNCSEHVDRGVLICVCLSSQVAGLEVRPYGQEDFVCPEEIVMEARKEEHKDEGSQCHGRLVCIMAGDQLRDTVGCVAHNNNLSACVHRVRQRLKGERLSITYELRL